VAAAACLVSIKNPDFKHARPSTVEPRALPLWAATTYAFPHNRHAVPLVMHFIIFDPSRKKSRKEKKICQENRKRDEARTMEYLSIGESNLSKRLNGDA